jgi:hypothetical protein
VRISRVSGDLRGSSGSGPVVYDDGRESVIPSGERNGPLRTRAGGVRISQAGGDLHVLRAPRGATVSTGGGTVVVGAGAGTVDASTGGGRVTVGPIAGSVRAQTGAGDVDVSISDAGGEPQSVTVATGLGRVVIEVPTNFSGTIDLEAGFTKRYGREPRVTTPWDLESRTTPDWDGSRGTPRRYVRTIGQVGRGGGVIRVRATNGDIEVRRAR